MRTLTKTYLRFWYMRWISQYNKTYCEQALLELISKIKKHSDYKCLDKIDSYFNFKVAHKTIFELNKTLVSYINSYKTSSTKYFHPGIHDLNFVKRGVLDYLTLKDSYYVEPSTGIDYLIKNSITLIDLIHNEQDSVKKKVMSEYTDTVLKESHVVLMTYFELLIDAEVISNF